MGRDKHHKQEKKKLPKYPKVSLLTPTFNRRPFVPMMLRCFELQNYPRDKMEWIIADDGTDKIGDLVSHIPEVKYFSFEEKMTLGKKRNFLNDQATGDIIVYIDDDDYYPPERVRHAVETLRMHPKAMLVGSSKMYVYFNDLKKIYQFGPYGPKHCTGATMAYRRELLATTRFEETACLAEERHFMKDYTVPMEQMDAEKVILVLAHSHSSVDKRTMIDGQNPRVHSTDLRIEDFVKDEQLLHFITEELDPILDAYEIGKPSSKPDLIQQKAEREVQRNQKQAEMQQKARDERDLFRALASLSAAKADASGSEITETPSQKAVAKAESARPPTVVSSTCANATAVKESINSAANAAHVLNDATLKRIHDLELQVAYNKGKLKLEEEKVATLTKEKMNLLRELAIFRVHQPQPPSQP